MESFFYEEFIDIMVRNTNIFIENIRNKYQRDRNAKDTDDATEVRAFIGALYLIGSKRSARENMHSFWENSKGKGLESCY
nr:unnamed protein product [Callosobruchus chinensis]